MASPRTSNILSDLLVGSPPPAADLPHRLVELCARSLPVTGVGLVLMTEAGPAGTVAASDGVATALEDLQFTLGEGPCVDSSVSGSTLLVPDLEQERRWPAFTAGALEAGARAVFALPLRVGAARLGVLDLYRDVAGVLPRADLAEALSFADAATWLLLHLQDEAPEEEATADGHPAGIALLEDRAEVHQATGMVAVQSGLALASALVLLRAQAFSAGRPVLDLARDVLTGVVHFGHDRES